MADLKKWYPNFYFLIFVFFQTLKLFPIIILTAQLIIIFLSRNVRWFMKLFLLINTLLLQLYLPDFIWFSSFQILILWLYFNPENTLVKPLKKEFSFNEKRFLIISFILAFSVRLIWILLTDNAGNGDAGMRLVGMKRWITIITTSDITTDSFSPYYLMPSRDWLPLHYYLIGLFSYITNEWIYTPRILSGLIGALTVIPLYKLTRLKFNKQTAFFSIILFLCYGYHIFLSSLVLSEVFYIFFVIWSYHFIEKWMQNDNDKMLRFLALSLSALCLLRYEGWFLVCVILIVLPFMKRINQWREYFVLCGMVGASVLCIMLLEIGYGEHPLRGILYSDFEVKTALGNKPVSLVHLFNEYLNSFVVFSVLSVILFIHKFKKINYLLLLLYLIPLVPFLYKLSNGTLTAQARYLSLYMVSLIPFIANVFYAIYLKYSSKFLFFTLTLFVITLNQSLVKSSVNNTILFNYPTGFHESTAFVRNMSDGYFYVDNCIQFGEFNWWVETDVNEDYVGVNWINQNTLRSTKTRNVFFISSCERDRSLTGVWDSQKFDSVLTNKKISHIMLFPNGELSELLKFSNPNEEYKGFLFKKIFDKNKHYIYEIVE